MACLRFLAGTGQPLICQNEHIKGSKLKLIFVLSTAIITVELDSSEYRVSEGDGNVTVCVQTDIGLPEHVDIQLRAFELLEELNNATGT